MRELRAEIRWLLSAAALFVCISGCEDRNGSGGNATTPPAADAANAGVSGAGQGVLDAPVAEANNRGVGWMGRFDFDKAAELFRPLSESHPQVHDLRLNYAIAILNRQQEGDSERALQILEQVLRDDPQHVRALYCRGLLLLNGGQPAEALEAFGKVVQADPNDAYALYYVGQCQFALGRVADALSSYEKAIELDRHVRSAYYGAFQCLQRLGRGEEARARLEEFRKLQDNPQARLAEFKYTRMGPKGEVVTVDAARPATAAAPAGPLFAEPAPLPLSNPQAVDWSGFGDSGAARAGITAADIDGDSRLDLFITGSAARGVPVTRNVVLLGRGGNFEIAPDHVLAAVTDVTASVWGDFDNDGLTDVYLARRGPGQLWRQSRAGQWEDVTAASLTGAGSYETVDGAWFDADHDGDLDLLLVRRDGPTELLNNNLDGTFRPIAEQAGLAGDGRGANGLCVADLNADGLADIIVVKAQPPHDVFLNDRLWRYQKAKALEAFAQSPADAVVAADADADGRVELYSLSAGEVSRWASNEVGAWQRTAVLPGKAAGPPGDPIAARWPAGLAVGDFAGSGTLDLLYASASGWSVKSLQPEAGRTDAAASHQPLLAWHSVTLDPAAGPAVVGLTSKGPPLIWRPGTGRWPFAALTFSGKHSKADQMRSNASGIGVTAAARTGSRWTAIDTYPAGHTGPGQSLQPVAVGLRGDRRIDFVNLRWPDGLRQTETDLEAGRLWRIEEVQRQTSSCPVLFAWDGSRFAFVTDCLGVGGVGFATGKPGEYAPPRPWENLLLPPGLPRPLNGRLVLKLGEPMEEACYLDSVALAAHDLPPGWSMTLDERMGIGEPQPTGRAFFFRRTALPSHAANDRGQDVTPLVTTVDGRAAPPGPGDPRFIGLTREHCLTLEFRVPLDAAGGRPLLVADGWVEYPYSQTMFAAWQAGVTYQAPTLEAWSRAPDAGGGDGKWVTVLEQFGYPAGMPRQMSVPIPLEKLPPGTTRLRLRTNQEVYWDRVFVAWAEECPDARRRTMELKAARVAEVGFAARTTGPQRRPHYDYDRRRPLWDTRHQDGFYTAFGSAEELVADADEAVAIFGPGEEVHVEFAAPREPPPEGWTRSFVLELAGWCKDRDLYTKDGHTIEPLPVREGATTEGLRRRDRLHERYQTRYRSGG